MNNTTTASTRRMNELLAAGWVRTGRIDRNRVTTIRHGREIESFRYVHHFARNAR